MNYQEFQKHVRDHILDYLPERYAEAEVCVQQVCKNNGVMLDGLSIRFPEENIAPAIYLNDYYKQYQMGRKVNGILEEIANIQIECQRPGYIDVDKLLDFNSIKDAIIFKVIGVHDNVEQLKLMPHHIEQDMAFVYQILVAKRENGNELITIDNNIQNRLGVSEEILYSLSMENTPKELPYTFRKIEDIMKKMIRDDFIHGMLEDNSNEEMREFLEHLDMMEEPGIPMYVLSNLYLINGAASLFYPEIKEQIAEELQGNYFVLPSSIHETLIIPDNGNIDYRELKAMVKQVNCTEVADTDILTGEVYYFDKKERTLVIAGEKEVIEKDKREISIKDKLLKKAETIKKEGVCKKAAEIVM